MQYQESFITARQRAGKAVTPPRYGSQVSSRFWGKGEPPAAFVFRIYAYRYSSYLCPQARRRRLVRGLQSERTSLAQAPRQQTTRTAAQLKLLLLILSQCERGHYCRGSHRKRQRNHSSAPN